ncbi:hypothetical protein [Pseudonocardia oceani]|uniref:hypothetical protein n=1 Tax=Pseudonocardia oceani TaxID=2792013 RepID=UPI001CF63A1F|nr:hypothetical protein [Pseudonocardia oceani]
MAITAAIDALLDGAPGALDTLNELAAAVNDDASFAASVTSALSGKVSKSGAETIAGIKTFSDAPVVPNGSFTIAKTTGLQTALDAKTALSVDGTPVSAYNLDSSPVAPGELSPPAYTQDEVDGLLAGVGGGNGPWAPVQDTGSETNFTTTNWTVVGGLAITIASTSTADVFRVDVLVDLASYFANTATMIWNLVVNGAGNPITYPIKLVDNGIRLSVPMAWVLTGLSPGNYTLELAAYMTGAGNYQSGPGTSMIAQRVV